MPCLCHLYGRQLGENRPISKWTLFAKSHTLGFPVFYLWVPLLHLRHLHGVGTKD